MRIAVLIPCYNEELTIEKVIRDFESALPSAKIYVYDNNSTDRTASIARESGAVVRHEVRQGKGNVVRRMFSDIDADVYVLVDGDDTYSAAAAPMLVEQLTAGLYDMVNAARVTSSKAAYRPGHQIGNRVISQLIHWSFGNVLSDTLSGYRVLSRRFVKSYPILSGGFEIETELNIHALQLRMPIKEIATDYKERPEGSFSKLNTISDGIRIVAVIGLLIKENKPLIFFGLVALTLFLLSLVAGIPIVEDYNRTGLVRRLPTAVLATGLMVMSALSIAAALILDSIARGRLETKKLYYLGIPVRTDV